MNEDQRYYGKYRGTVSSNVDPNQRGRLQVKVPRVHQGGVNWAEPCVPFAGPGVGMFLLPPKGANVWVEFVEGNANDAIWSGCFWNDGDAPAKPAVEGMRVIATETATITIDELTERGVIIETAAGAKISLTASGIEITNGSATISLSGPSVSINNGAFEVI